MLDLDSFYPQKDRFELALALNNLLAAPGFQLWMQGEPLDIGQLLRSDAGKPRVAIFSIAHLSDAERMFFVTLLLNAVLAWMRGQSGTTSLRALLYMDEIFGYFPPTANPPSKKPLLTLLKQARAFGLGVVLATQNPVDLDYKGLSNAGTWFIGRLQTEQDKQRVLDGLEGASGQGGLDRAPAREADLGARQPRLPAEQRARERARGVPDALDDVVPARPALAPADRLADDAAQGGDATARAAPAAAAAPVAAAPAAAAPGAAAAPAPVSAAATAPARAERRLARPTCRCAARRPPARSLAYLPMLIGVARVRLLDTKSQVDEAMRERPPRGLRRRPDRRRLVGRLGPRGRRRRSRVDSARRRVVPRPAARPRATRRPMRTGRRTTPTGSTRPQTVQLFRSPSQKLVSHSGESEADFRARLAQGAREGRDSKADALRAKYDAKVAALQQKLHTAQQAVDREENQERGAGLQTAVSVAGSILGGFLGRKSVSVGSITSVARGAGRVAQQRDDVKRAEENVTLLQSQLADLQASFAQDAAGMGADGAATEQLDSVVIRPKKADIDVTLVTLAFAPHWQDAGGALTPALLRSISRRNLPLSAPNRIALQCYGRNEGPVTDSLTAHRRRVPGVRVFVAAVIAAAVVAAAVPALRSSQRARRDGLVHAGRRPGPRRTRRSRSRS